MRFISKIFHNWHYSSITDNGPESEYSFVGHKGVKEIVQHLPQGDGDRLYYDILFDDGSMRRVFNPNEVVFENVECDK